MPLKFELAVPDVAEPPQPPEVPPRIRLINRKVIDLALSDPPTRYWMREAPRLDERVWDLAHTACGGIPLLELLVQHGWSQVAWERVSEAIARGYRHG